MTMHINIVLRSHNRTLCYRHANVICTGTEEAEIIDPRFASAFRRPPTVGHFEIPTISGTPFYAAACI